MNGIDSSWFQSSDTWVETEALLAQLELGRFVHRKSFDSNPDSVQGLLIFDDPTLSLVLIEPSVPWADEGIAFDCDLALGIGTDNGFAAADRKRVRRARRRRLKK